MSSPDSDPAPPIELYCAGALTESFTPSEEMDRAKAVMQSSPRMPAVGFYGSRYGERWHVDLVSLPHNAIRRQLYDAFTIANALGKMTLDIADADLARVYAWLGTLHTFVAAVLDAEHRLLYPLVDNNLKKLPHQDGAPVYLPELLSVRGRTDAKMQIMDLLEAARKTRDVATGETSAKIVALRYALDQFGANILDYFAAMEKVVPKILKKTLRHGQRDKDKLEKKLFERLLQQNHGGMLAALLLQCVESRTKRDDFVHRCLRREKDRAAFRQHVKRVEMTHMQLARTFDMVAMRYERRFNVNKFLERYDENADKQREMTLAMLGDMDLDDEGDAEADPTAVGNTVAGGAVEVVAPVEGVNEQGDGLDDDVLEVVAAI
eukprot:GFKZ01009983.1.p1 GENE.GFKZ01009983.1~~GFKZ01009983.1.p1  ORF type:complete len:378 (-),score=83.02 GFKZ01009983.1:1716-2849(-)